MVTSRSKSRVLYPSPVRINVVTIFPEFFESPLRVSIVARALAAGTLEIDLIDLRHHGLGNHRQVDDSPYGGGAGMVMMIEPLAAALEPLARHSPRAFRSHRAPDDPVHPR